MCLNDKPGLIGFSWSANQSAQSRPARQIRLSMNATLMGVAVKQSWPPQQEKVGNPASMDRADKHPFINLAGMFPHPNIHSGKSGTWACATH
jgi:hypothetical protein